jgi:hypothetical protein
VSFRDLLFLCSGFPVWAELREIVINALLQFVVKNHAEIPPALALDLIGCRVMHSIQVGIVMGFTGLGKAVMDGLILRNPLRDDQKLMTLLTQSSDLLTCPQRVARMGVFRRWGADLKLSAF